MKTLFACLLFALVIAGCKFIPDNKINDAAVHVSGVFITDNISSIQLLRIKGSRTVKVDTDSTYHVSGTVEGYSPLNYPVSVETFSETVKYLGGDIKDVKSWKCIEIYIGSKKMK